MDLPTLVSGTLIRRYKRFLADVELADGVIIAHCPNTGAMTGCAEPGSPVWLSVSDNPKRKYAHTLELVESKNGLVSVNTSRANHLVGEGLHSGVVDLGQDVIDIRAEAALEHDGVRSRFDFLVQTKRGQVWVEVKSATLYTGEQCGVFPDAVSTRALKHVELLAQRVREGDRGVLIFCAQHTGIEKMGLAQAIDPKYCEGVQTALEQGVEVYAYGCAVDLGNLRMLVDRQLPFTASNLP